MRIVLGEKFFIRLFLASEFAGGREVGGIAPLIDMNDHYYSPSIIICSDRASHGGHDMEGQTLARAAAMAMKDGYKVGDLNHFVHTHGRASTAFYSPIDTDTISEQVADGSEIVSTVIGSPVDMVSRLDYRYGPLPRMTVTEDLEPEWHSDVDKYLDIYKRINKAKTNLIISRGAWQGVKAGPVKTQERIRLQYRAANKAYKVAGWPLREIWPVVLGASDEDLEWLVLNEVKAEAIQWLLVAEMETFGNDTEVPSGSAIQTFFGVSR